MKCSPEQLRSALLPAGIDATVVRHMLDVGTKEVQNAMEQNGMAFEHPDTQKHIATIQKRIAAHVAEGDFYDWTTPRS